MAMVNYWQKDIETMKRSELNALQLERLKYIVRYCYENVPFYKKRFDEIGLKPEHIQSFQDVEKIPFTTKDDIRDNYPFGLFAVPQKKIVRMHASSGTTGKPTVVGYTRNDLNTWSDLVARLCVAAGVNDDDIAQISFGYGLFTGALGLHYGLEKIGASIVPASSGNTEKQVMLLKDFGVTVLVATPSYALHIGEVVRDMGFTTDDLSLRIGLFGSEGCTEEMRAAVEESLGLFATDNYGMSELIGPGVSGDCQYRTGMHIAEDHFYPEIVDRNTLKPLKEGEIGELVITTLTKEGFPLLRYRTKDITRINYDADCPCGRTHARMAKIMGRSDDMLKIKGVNVFPSQIESVLMTTPHIGPQYQLVLTRNGFMDNIEVVVEVVDGNLLTRYAELEMLEHDIRHRLQTVLGLDCKITLKEPRSIERTAGKAKRVIDLRNKGTI